MAFDADGAAGFDNLESDQSKTATKPELERPVLARGVRVTTANADLRQGAQGGRHWQMPTMRVKYATSRAQTEGGTGVRCHSKQATRGVPESGAGLLFLD
jgi:hypothetical protein